MTSPWRRTLRSRMNGFESMLPPPPGKMAVSVKVREVGFHLDTRDMDQVYDTVSRFLEHASGDPDLEVIRHESGPEILVYCAVATAGITLAKSVIDLITAILKVRSSSVRKGHRPLQPVELIVRRTVESRGVSDETVLKLGRCEKVDRKTIERELKKALSKLISERENSQR